MSAAAATTDSAAVTSVPVALDPAETRLAEAHGMVKRAAAWGFGAGCIPLPWIDLAALTGVHLNLISKLSTLYGVPFSEHTAKNVIVALLGSIVPNQLTWGALGSAIKAIPGVGAPLALLTMPGFSAAATWAIGRIYIQHLEAGGNLLNFDPVKLRAHFRTEFEAAKRSEPQPVTKSA